MMNVAFFSDIRNQEKKPKKKKKKRLHRPNFSSNVCVVFLIVLWGVNIKVQF